ncbi:CLUMA_CG019303, isoform A [Clunio marinus]|uniref:CLUMA_CG019303, isoform A n=1 Tax=Clunio marinus TaxID=568069 RepID=A0A1J1J5F1_9DIPT|nr:CLUMA_CG019303, isoform A [Clunio marinus]
MKIQLIDKNNINQAIVKGDWRIVNKLSWSKSSFLHAALLLSADLQNIRDECFFDFSHLLMSTDNHGAALIYLEVHEEIFNEITSCF